MILAPSILGLAPPAHGAGTAAGTTISNTAGARWFQATGDTASPPAESLVRAIFGETIPDLPDTTIGVGGTAIFTYPIMNNGNTADSFSVWISETTPAGGAVGWRVTLFVGGESTSAVNDTKTTPSVPADGTFSCSVVVASDSDPFKSPDGSNVAFTLRVQSVGNPAAVEYKGDNGETYSAGGGIQTDTARATVAGTLDRFAVTPNTTAITAGETVVLTIAALDASGNTMASFAETANLSYSPSGSGDTPFATGPFVAGVRIETATLTAAGSVVIKVESGTAAGTSVVTVAAAPAAAFLVSAPASAAAGDPFQITVTAVDTWGNTATSFGETATISDSTGLVTPTTSGAFVAGVRTETVRVGTVHPADLIRFARGGITGGAVVAIGAATSNVLVEAWAETEPGGGMTIIVRVLDESGALAPTSGDTVRMTWTGGEPSRMPANPFDTVTRNGVARVPWAGTDSGLVEFTIDVTRVGDSGPVTTSAFALQIAPSDPVRTVATPAGGMLQAPLSLFPDSWSLVIRPVLAEDRWMIFEAGKRIPAGLAMPGTETDVPREFFAVRADGTRVTGDLGQPVTIWMRYRDDDGDGVVDGTAIRSSDLRFYLLDESDLVWVLHTNSGFGQNQWVKAIIEHFSFGTILGQSGVSGLGATVSYPNPFYPLEAGSTRGGVPQAGFVTIDTRRGGHTWMRVTIYNLAGDVVRRIDQPSAGAGQTGVDLDAGVAFWDGRNAAGQVVASGLYLYTVESDLGTARGKMVIIK